MKKHNNTFKVVLLLVTIVLLLAAIFIPDKSWGILAKAAIALVELFLILFGLKEKHGAVKGVMIATLMFIVLSWILPAAYFSGEYIDQGRVQMGLFDLFAYPMDVVLPYFGFIIIALLIIGGFYGILHKIPAYRTFLDKIVERSKDREEAILVMMMIIVAVFTSIFGLQMGMIAFFPLMASIILLMGYDKIVAALTIVGSTVVGMIGTTYGYSTVSILNETLGVEYTDNMIVKVVILLVALVLLIFNTIIYAKSNKVVSKKNLTADKKVIKTEETKEEVVVEKVDTSNSTKKTNAPSKNSKNNKNGKKSSSNKSSSKAKKNDNKAALTDDEVIVVKESLGGDSLDGLVPTVVGTKHKVWPFVVTFMLLFILVVLALVPWVEVFELDAFSEATTNLTEFKLFGFPIFGKLLGSVSAFGTWTLYNYSFLLIFFGLLLALIYKVKWDDVLDGIANGVKKALGPAFVALLIYTCLVITTYHPFQLVIYKALLGLTDGFNVVTTAAVGFLSSLFNGDSAYVFQAAVPYFASVVTDSSVYPIAFIVFQSIYGLSMLVAPTSLFLAITLSYLGVSFKQWFKAIWKLVVELLIVLLIVFAILVILI